MAASLPSWEGVSNDIMTAIHNLLVSAKNGDRQQYVSLPSLFNLARYISQSSLVVEAIRVMLYSSGTARKDSPVVLSHKNLRSNHRQIMSSLSKLVLASKLASGTQPPEDAVVKMQSCCRDVLTAVRHFIASAIEADVPLSRVESSNEGAAGGRHPARLESAVSQNTVGTYEPMAENSHQTSETQMASSMTMGANLISYLERYTRSVVKMISLLMKSIREEQCSSQKLIQDVRAMVTEVGNFLAAVDEMPIDTLTDELSVDFKVNRLSLYNSISGLVMATQTATSPLAPANAMEQVVLSTGLVEKAVKDLLISTKFLVEEKESMEQHGSEEDPVKPRRTVSLSALAPPVLTAIPEAELTIKPGHVGRGNNSRFDENVPPKSAGPLGGSRPFDESSGGYSLEKVKTSGREKLKKFFGDSSFNSSSTSHPLPPVPVAASAKVEVPRPWYLEYDYAENDLQFTAEGSQVKGGTIEALVERLTLHDSYSMCACNSSNTLYI